MAKTLLLVVQKLNDHIHSLRAGTYILRLGLLCLEAWNLSQSELLARRAAHEAFTQLPHYRNVSKAIGDRFLKTLYPHNNELGLFFTKFKLHNNVNHASLYESYCHLPLPGVAHMKYEDFEQFMTELMSFRKWVRPKKLSLSNLHLLKKKDVLQLFLNSIAVRKEHLNAVLHVTRDMKRAGIPLSNHERRSLIYKTFYRDRQDILDHVRTLLQDNPHYRQPIMDALRKLPFDMDTYENIWGSFDDPSTETLNTFLFTALRHNDTEVLKSVLARYLSYDRDTFKILLENLAFHRNGDYLKYLDLLVSDYTHLIDIKLVNIIISSLVTLRHIKPAESVLASMAEHLPETRPDDMFLKLLSHEDRKKYSRILAQYDALPSQPKCILLPTSETYLPILKFHCEKADFPKVCDILSQVENVAKLPLTSQMFKYVYLYFARFAGPLQDLQYVTGKLIESHDMNNMGQDSWSNELINEGVLPETLVDFLQSSQKTPEYDVNSSNYVKLSTELMKVIFIAYKKTLEGKRELKQVYKIEQELNKQMADAIRNVLQPRGRHQPVHLSKQDELTYLRKTSLFRLFDLD